MADICFEELMAKAKEARRNSYSPYSRYRVGAALLGESGTVYLGCNVENASYGVTICAERTALVSAIASGERRFKALALVGGKEDTPDEAVFPCGICRQALTEFCSLDMPIAVYDINKGFSVYQLRDLLPFAFTPDNL